MSPNVTAIADEAREIVARLESHRQFPEFKAASLNYSDDWQCFTGFPVIDRWNLEADAEPLFREGLRALALKAAVWVATGDDQEAEIPIAVPVDEMTHAMIAQTQLLHTTAAAVGVRIIHQTDQEHTDYHAATVTHDLYVAAFDQEPPARYWLDHQEVEARREHLAGLYEQIGMGRSGREHTIEFATLA
jgi:hypothetical protein